MVLSFTIVQTVHPAIVEALPLPSAGATFGVADTVLAIAAEMRVAIETADDAGARRAAREICKREWMGNFSGDVYVAPPDAAKNIDFDGQLLLRRGGQRGAMRCRWET